MVPDEDQEMDILIQGGGSIEVISRADSGKTPLIKHHDGGGKITISTGIMGDIILENGLRVTPRDIRHSIDINKGEIPDANSIAFELVSDSDRMEDTVFRTSSSNRYILLEN